MISYRPDFKCWWPDYDANPVACHAKVLRRLPDADLWTRLTRARGSVVQAGGHCGFWPNRIARHAHHVFTFEPDNACYQALAKNVEGVKNIHHSQAGLGRDFGEVRFATKGSAGSARVHDRGADIVQIVPIDSLRLHDCAAIILDVEGYEIEALIGAEETINRCRPIIHLEDSDVPVQDAWMNAHGYEMIMKVHSDRLFRSRK